MTTHDDRTTPGDLESALARWRGALEDGAFEETFAALEEVVDRLERGQLRLEETLACYELGVRLAERCGRILDDAELRVTRLDAALGETEAAASDEPLDDTPRDGDESE